MRYYIWTYSGNENLDGPPRMAGSSEDVLVADGNIDYDTVSVAYSYHSTDPTVHRDTSRLHGDGHAENNTELKYFVARKQPGLVTRFAY